MDSSETKWKPESKPNIANAAEIEEEEDASTLQFPKEFRNAEPLFISEVLLLLQFKKKANEKEEDSSELSRVFHNTLDYATKFATFKHRVIIREVRELMAQKKLRLLPASGGTQGTNSSGTGGEAGEPDGEFAKLHKFEIACLANLTPDNGDETCALIRSLNRFDPAELDQLCDDIKTQKSFQATSVDIDDAMES